MKYSEILDDVLAGKWVRTNPNCEWIRMGEEGVFYDEAGCKTNIRRNTYTFKTWEVKPDEIYVWGVSKGDDGKYVSYLGNEFLCDFTLESNPSHNVVRYSGRPLFPTDKPQKYKLVPVEDEG